MQSVYAAIKMNRKRSTGGKFISAKVAAKRARVSAVMKERYKRKSLSQDEEKQDCENDHTYTCPPDQHQAQYDPNLVSHEEYANESENGTPAWQDGRRIVELGLLAERLSHCSECSFPLHLKDTVSETRFGLGGVFACGMSKHAVWDCQSSAIWQQAQHF